MTSVDLLLSCFTLGAAFNGMRRGFLQEALLFALWLPLYAVFIVLAFKTYHPANQPGNTNWLGHDVFWLLGVTFFMGLVVITFINKGFIAPWLERRRLSGSHTLNSFFGFLLGPTRLLALIVLSTLLYDVFVSPFNLAGVPNFAYVRQAYTLTKPLKHWLIEHNYLKQEIILYDRDYSEEQEHKNQLKKQFGDIFPKGLN